MVLCLEQGRSHPSCRRHRVAESALRTPGRTDAVLGFATSRAAIFLGDVRTIYAHAGAVGRSAWVRPASMLCERTPDAADARDKVNWSPKSVGKAKKIAANSSLVRVGAKHRVARAMSSRLPFRLPPRHEFARDCPLWASKSDEFPFLTKRPPYYAVGPAAVKWPK